MSEWQSVRLGDLIKVTSGFAFKSEDFSKDRNAIPIVRMSDLKSGFLNTDNSARVLYKDEYRKSQLNEGDFLFGMSGSIENFAIVKKENLPCLLNQRVGKFEFKSDTIPTFCGYLYLSEQVQRQLKIDAVGAAQVNLSGKDIEKIIVNVPTSLKEQSKIAEILSTVDQVIGLAEKEISRLEVLKKGIMNDLFARGIEKTKLKIKSKTSLSEPIKSVPLRDLARLGRGSSPRPAGDPKFFKGSHTPWLTVGEVTAVDYPYLDRTKTYLTAAGRERSTLIPKGTVVLTNSGFSLGMPKILQIDACANDGILYFGNLVESVHPEYLYLFLRGMTEKFRSTIGRGVEQPNLNTEIVGNIEIPLHPICEQRSISAVVFSVMGHIRGCQKYVEQIETIKKALMNDLLTGKVRVKV